MATTDTREPTPNTDGEDDLTLALWRAFGWACFAEDTTDRQRALLALQERDRLVAANRALLRSPVERGEGEHPRSFVSEEAREEAGPPAPVEGEREPDARAVLTRLYLAAHRAGVDAAADHLWSGSAGASAELSAARESLAADARADTEDEYNWSDPESPLAQALTALPVQGEPGRPSGWPALLDLPEMPDIPLPCARCGEAVCECEQKERDAEEREAIARDFEQYVEIVRGVFNRAVQEAVAVLNYGDIVDNPVELLRASIAADVTRRLNGIESKILSALRGTLATPTPEEP